MDKVYLSLAPKNPGSPLRKQWTHIYLTNTRSVWAPLPHSLLDVPFQPLPILECTQLSHISLQHSTWKVPALQTVTSFQSTTRKSEHSAPLPMFGSRALARQHSQERCRSGCGYISANAAVNEREATRTTLAVAIPGSTIRRVRRVLNCCQFALWTNCHWKQ